MALLSGIGIVIGIVGTVLPILPGLALVWLSAFVYGLVEGFGVWGWTAMAVITLVGGAAVVAGVRIPQRAAARGGIPLRGQIFAAVLAVGGFFVIPVLGAPLGFVLGVWIVARSRHGDRAWEVTRSSVGALVAAASVQFGAAVVMGAVWLAWVVVD